MVAFGGPLGASVALKEKGNEEEQTICNRKSRHREPAGVSSTTAHSHGALGLLRQFLPGWCKNRGEIRDRVHSADRLERRVHLVRRLSGAQQPGRSCVHSCQEWQGRRLQNSRGGGTPGRYCVH